MVWALPLLTTKLSPRCLTPALLIHGIRSLVEFGNLGRPLVHPALYHRDGPREASPYPQLIQAVFNQH
jgi:hypothetical protein